MIRKKDLEREILELVKEIDKESLKSIDLNFLEELAEKIDFYLELRTNKTEEGGSSEIH
jgi:hypothetical protein